MKHIGIFANSGAVATAIENEALLNPYVAMVSGVIDYNSVSAGPVIPSQGLAVLTSDGLIYSGTQEEPDCCTGYTVEFEKPYDSTFTVYFNGSIVSLQDTTMVNYHNCPFIGEDPEVCQGECWKWESSKEYAGGEPLEDIDFGTDIGEPGDTVTVSVFYNDCTGQDEEMCGISWCDIDIKNENCYTCDSDEYTTDQERCDCAGGDLADDGEGNYWCDCDNAENYDECDCKAQGGYWTGEECIYPWDYGGGEDEGL